VEAPTDAALASLIDPYKKKNGRKNLPGITDASREGLRAHSRH
jgi:hypothetical protein